ncbi:hypothetical protein ARMGADRAFT_1085563 [Armillaria gallica]|uniref:Uncharacterized protein n=1 Tax=Armillaria gallica TaxID=47427 RepID=A0A2H3CX11_ARMGA|nr:hypothetical protein ARMGADRAFT_1085563 [Armillaria gallica]
MSQIYAPLQEAALYSSSPEPIVSVAGVLVVLIVVLAVTFLSIVSVFLLLRRENRYHLFRGQLQDWWPSQYELKTVLVDAFMAAIVHKEIHLFIVSPPPRWSWKVNGAPGCPFAYWRDGTE